MRKCENVEMKQGKFDLSESYLHIYTFITFSHLYYE